MRFQKKMDFKRHYEHSDKPDKQQWKHSTRKRDTKALFKDIIADEPKGCHICGKVKHTAKSDCPGKKPKVK